MEKRSNVLPKSIIGMAKSCTLNLWSRLKVYLTNAQVVMDNNLIENTTRPVAPGRKNYLFAGSHSMSRFSGKLHNEVQ
jgi:transposase